MTEPQTVTLFLEDPLLQSAKARQHNFINLMVGILEKAFVRVEYRPLKERLAGCEGHSLTHMASPPNDAGLVFRRVYHYPFWQIDAVPQRWHWDVAKAQFNPDDVPEDAGRFFRFWQKRLFGAAAAESRREGFVYVPLQGHLRMQRPFQDCTPIDMVRQVAEQSGRRVIATLHPKEHYSALDLAALRSLTREFPQLEIGKGEMEKHLAGCDYVVTQNSAVAFSGFFFRKPALLYAPIDFHHITVRSDPADLEGCFDAVTNHAPPFARYLWWFWQDQSINAGREDAQDRIAARLRRFGWPIP